MLSRQISVISEMRKNSSLSSLRPIKSLLSSLQFQQQKEEAVPEDVEEGVANRHIKVCVYNLRAGTNPLNVSNIQRF